MADRTPAGIRRHAVVIGGSIGGLLAAATLADHFDHVTVFERDPLPIVPIRARERRKPDTSTCC